ncbi:MAG: sensor histidine kinase [Gemmatimonadaceae bacterium]
MTVESLADDAWVPHAWRRWMHRWPWFALAALMLSLAVWAFDDHLAPSQWTRVLPAVAALLLWYWRWTAEMDRSPQRRQWSLPLLAAAAISLSIYLTHLSMSFWLLGLVFIPLLFVVLPIGWSLLAVALLTAHAGWESRFGGEHATLSSTELLAFLLSRALLAAVIGIFLRRVVRLADNRERLAMELQATRAELARAAHHAGTMDERQRITRELHDTLTQGLSAVVMHLETAEQMLPEPAVETRVQMQRARAIARESLDDTRRVMASLRPELLEHVELPEAVARWCAQTAERTAMPVTSTVTGTPAPLHPEAEITIFRALQEGLANVRKHASAHAATVTLSYMDDVVMLDVRDDGIGFDVANTGTLTTNGSFGLRAMRERVELLHGSVTIESERGEGTTLTVAIPMLHTAELPVFRRMET